MKKFIYLFVLSLLLMTGCQVSVPIEICYENFIDIRWTRNGGHDIETISFKSDGSFVYYCSCGNPVNDSDLCDSYTYNDKTHEISLNYFELTDEAVTNLRIMNLIKDEIQIDFDGEIRIFTKE